MNQISTRGRVTDLNEGSALTQCNANAHARHWSVARQTREHGCAARKKCGAHACVWVEEDGRDVHGRGLLRGLELDLCSCSHAPSDASWLMLILLPPLS